MNTTEKKYAVERVNDIASRKRRKAEDETYTAAVGLSLDKKIDMVQTGKVKVRKIVTTRYGTPSFADLFDFSKYEKSDKVDTEKRGKLVTRINAEARKIRDKIMLGDSQEAIKLIEAFEKF